VKLNCQKATDVLVNNESLPEFNYDHFSSSWQSWCTEWEGKQLVTFAHIGKKTSRWGWKIDSGWFKCKSAYDPIEIMMREYKLKTAYSAAKFLDDCRVEVVNLPMGKHVEKIVKDDNSKQQRVHVIKPKQLQPNKPHCNKKITAQPTANI
jgi:hypothetical protein